MKVLTVREPYVTPMALGMKHYETRSWGTKYRGEIYIHTAKKIYGFKSSKEKFFPLGYIVLKANLADCIKMDESFVEEIKRDPDEYRFGFYEIDRYAWKLENIVELIDPIKATGHLGIWNYKEM